MIYVTHGKLFNAAKLVRGNHIDALPYWSESYDLQNPSWEYTGFLKRKQDLKQKQCLGKDVAGFASILGDGSTLKDFALPRGGGYVLPTFTSAEREKVRNFSETKAKAKLRAGLINAPLLIAERAQTIGMIAERVGDIARIATSVQKRDLSKWKRLKSAKSKRAFAQKAASSHLELIFGWLPVIDEIMGAIELITEERRNFIIGRGKYSMVKELPNTVKHHESPWTISDQVKLDPTPFVSLTKARTVYSARTSLKCDITMMIASDMRKMGFNPLYSLYDLTPLSFISGWVSNFNNWVQSCDPLIGATYRTGSTSLRTTETVLRECHPRDAQFSGHGKASWDKIRTDRVVLSSEPESTFGFHNNLSFYSVTAGISLYLQRRLKPLTKALAVKQFRYRSPKKINLPPIKYTGVIK